MDGQVLLAVGGVGLFLLGLLILTDGLKGLAGATLRQWLAHFTRSPTSGAAAGTVMTAVIQSSSATTVTAIGFVGAGLLTFPQALGIIFGANIGTTLTGWMVAVIGFKLDLGAFAPPLLLIGSLMKLFAPGRWAQAGWALAGFGLLFVGIDTMQAGLAPFEGLVTPDDFPGDTLTGRLLLVLLGVAITLVTQSSSAGVATALVALQAGAISFPQAAAMVIGMDVGTTFTAALATVGGSTAMRQTGFAHVIYNVMTGVFAFLLLIPVSALSAVYDLSAPGNAQISLVAFHSVFNILGVVLVLPLAHPFSRLIQGLVPEKQPPLVRRLDRQFLSDADTATDAALFTLSAITDRFANHLAQILPDGTGERTSPELDASPLRNAVRQTQDYLEQIRTRGMSANTARRHADGMHCLDHLNRLSYRVGQANRIRAMHDDPRLRRLGRVLRSELQRLSHPTRPAESAERLDRLRRLLRRQRRRYREQIIEQGPNAPLDADQILARLDALRWLHRVSYHFWRIVAHLDNHGDGVPPYDEPD